MKCHNCNIQNLEATDRFCANCGSLIGEASSVQKESKEVLTPFISQPIHFENVKVFARYNTGMRNNSGLEVTISDAIKLIDKQPTKKKYAENFLGFSIDVFSGIEIQYFRNEENEWEIEIPILKNNHYKHSLHAIIKTIEVIKITSDFLNEKRLASLIKDHNEDELISYFKESYNISLL